jgi:non-homologous end joining protein Ku
VLRIIKPKQQGKEIVAEEPPEKPAPVTDLMAALRASIDEKKPRRSHRRQSRRRAS